MEWLLNYYPEANSTGPTFDEWVEKLDTQLGGELFFVEIGAMDGVRHDALYQHVHAHPSWSGLLVEPLPDMFEKLKKTYEGRQNLSFANVAITETDGTAMISRIPADKIEKHVVPDWADGISTLKPDEHIITEYGELKQHIVEQEIQTATFQTLAEQYGITAINVLQTDTEGYDKVIFSQIWEAGFRPQIIKLEINYLTYKAIKDLRWFLKNEGYQTFYQGDDLIAVKL